MRHREIVTLTYPHHQTEIPQSFGIKQHCQKMSVSYSDNRYFVFYIAAGNYHLS